MGKHLKLIVSKYFSPYTEKLDINIFENFNNLKTKNSFKIEDFEYYIISSSLYSSKIEGNQLDVNSFFRSRNKKTTPKLRQVKEIETLMEAYSFATKNKLNRTNFLKAHGLFSKTLLPIKERGKLRKDMVGIRDSKTMKPIYLAVEPEFLSDEFNKLFDDIDLLIKRKLTYRETFYYASMLHIWLAQIHPFIDGNGRAARLLEKWFLANKLGLEAWSISSEKYYWDNRPDYYNNIGIGYNYYALHWERCITFLLMLPKALTSS
jgi:Fic family protein